MVLRVGIPNMVRPRLRTWMLFKWMDHQILKQTLQIFARFVVVIIVAAYVGHVLFNPNLLQMDALTERG